MKGSVLVLGRGNSDTVRVDITDKVVEGKQAPTFHESFQEVVSLDIDKACNPTHVWNLDDFPWPVPRNHFDEVHAYEVLEHLGITGDPVSYFALWREIWEVLKPGGVVCATTPWWESIWTWADPGHRRVYSEAILVYLSQSEYKRQIGVTAMTDYRSLWPEPYHFDLVHQVKPDDTKVGGYIFILKKGEHASKDEGGRDRSPGGASPSAG